MCVGPEIAMIASLAASGAGTYLESKEQQRNDKRIQNAKNAAFVQEMNDQRKFADEAGAQFGQNIQDQGRESFDLQKQLEADKIQNAFTERRTQPDYNIGLAADAPKNVVIERQAASDTAAGKTNRDIENLSRLSGYQGALFNQGLTENEFARMFGNVQDRASAQGRLLPLRMNAAANNASRMPSLFPKLLKAGGQMGSMAASSGSFTPETITWQPRAGYGPFNGSQTSTLKSPFENMISRRP